MAITMMISAKITPIPSNISANLLMVSPKKRGVGSCPYIIKITTRIICMNLISYAEDAGQASKMNWCYEKKR